MKKGKYKKIYLSEWISKNETVDDAFNNLVGQRVLFFVRKQDRCLEGIVLDTTDETVEFTGYEPFIQRTILLEDHGWFKLNAADPDGNYIIAILEEWPEDKPKKLGKPHDPDEAFRKAVKEHIDDLNKKANPLPMPRWPKYPTIPQQPIYPHYPPRPYDYPKPYDPGVPPYEIWC